MILLRFIGISLLFFLPAVSHATIQVFACEPEWASLATEIGGEQVSVFSATHAKQDPHHVSARPSLIAKARQADLLICSGASLETGWLPILLQKSSAHIQPGKLGHLMASEHVDLLETFSQTDRSMGDVHPEGNPHVHLNPHNILRIAIEIKNRLQAINPANTSLYHQQHAQFEARWLNAIARWENKAQPLKNKSVVVHHNSFIYLTNWLGLNQHFSLESVPGIPPTPKHLQRLANSVNPSNTLAILRAPYNPAKPSLWLSNKTGVPAILLPFTVGGDEASTDLFGLFDRTIEQLLSNLPHDAL